MSTHIDENDTPSLALASGPSEQEIHTALEDAITVLLVTAINGSEHAVPRLRWLRGALPGLLADTRRVAWCEANAGRWTVAFVAFSGKWRCEGPNDELIDDRYATWRDAVDAAASVAAVPEETQEIE